MGLEDIEAKVIGIENLMPQRDIQLENSNYRVYLEENVKDTDRCFGLSSIDDPSDIKLFQITTEMGNNKNFSKQLLSELDIQDEGTAKYLLKNALEIVNGTKEKLANGNILMKDLLKTVAVGKNNYILSYQPPTAGVVNMREQYMKRVMGRIYGY